ncbi:THAP domain-containing protein 10-like [Latimeria chalumnae]|uniref:THAP domain-containing protein 1 n=1 Tax=Latimeria chalumnae TaxID=7897 RepID=M3XKS4_LATCH|nr:PREDICTED: THAP domain-containing protein 10-like [Latimeria chalumnae]|eukprot:XP_006013814.1 PREDICTED: THAP domain-containing protein 10-like [Latimeria chalumnae]
MPLRCVAANCCNEKKEGISLFRFPKDKRIRAAWNSFVSTRRANWKGANDRSVLCSYHFTDDAFDPSSVMQVKMKASKRLRLLEGALPIIHANNPSIKERKLPTVLNSGLPLATKDAQKKTRGVARKRTVAEIVNELKRVHYGPEFLSSNALDFEPVLSIDFQTSDTAPHVDSRELPCSSIKHIQSAETQFSGFKKLRRSVGVQVQIQNVKVETRDIGVQTKELWDPLHASTSIPMCKSDWKSTLDSMGDSYIANNPSKNSDEEPRYSPRRIKCEPVDDYTVY